MNYCCSELDTASGSTRQWICCALDSLSLNTVCGSTREWIYCILDIVHILERTVQLCKLSEYLYTDILNDWTWKGSQDKDILCYHILNGLQDTDIWVLVDTGRITGQIAGYSGQT